MTQYRLKEQHYDTPAGTVVYGVSEAVPQPGQGESMLVTPIEGNVSANVVFVIPLDKLEEIT